MQFTFELGLEGYDAYMRHKLKEELFGQRGHRGGLSPRIRMSSLWFIRTFETGANNIWEH